MPVAKGPADIDTRAASDTDKVAARMLELAVAQITLALHDGQVAVDSLDRTFTSAARSVASIASRMPSTANDYSAIDKSLLDHCTDAQVGVQQSIVALQFYDRLAQRLEHVRQLLGGMAVILDEPAQGAADPRWRALQSTTRQGYTMPEEQVLFDAILSGLGVERAMDAALEQEKQSEQDIELF